MIPYPAEKEKLNEKIAQVGEKKGPSLGFPAAKWLPLLLSFWGLGVSSSAEDSRVTPPLPPPPFEKGGQKLYVSDNKFVYRLLFRSLR